jgi:amidase
LLAGGGVLLMPTVPRLPVLRDQPSEVVVPFRNQCLNLLCVAGLCRLPQLSLPLATAEGCPVGLSLLGARGADRTLLDLAERIAAAAQSS